MVISWIKRRTMEVSSIDGLSHSRGFPIEMCSGYNVARCRTRGHYWPVTIRQCKHKKGGEAGERKQGSGSARRRRGPWKTEVRWIRSAAQDTAVVSECREWTQGYDMTFSAPAFREPRTRVSLPNKLCTVCKDCLRKSLRLDFSNMYLLSVVCFCVVRYVFSWFGFSPVVWASCFCYLQSTVKHLV